MDNFQPVLLAATIGTVLFAGAYKAFDSFKASPPPVQQKSKKKSKNKKAKNKNKKKKVVEIPKALAERDIDDIRNNVPVKKQAEPAKSATVQEAAQGKSKGKKKKQRQKKKTVVKVSSDEEDSDSDEEFVKPKKKAPEPPAPSPVAMPTQAQIEADEADGWTTVGSRSRNITRSGLADSDIQTSVQVDGKVKIYKKSLNLGDYVSLIVGQGGNTITNIEQVSGAKVNVVKESKSCVVSGEEDAVDMATQMIRSIIDNQARDVVTLTSRLDKAIISKADTKQKIRTLSGAKLDYKYNDEAAGSPLEIIITGEADRVALAKTLIQDYLDGKTPDGGKGIQRLQVSAFQARIIIGQKGDMINKFQKETGASINVDFSMDGQPVSTDNQGQAIVTVIGTPVQIENGIGKITDFLTEHNYNIQVEVEKDAARGVMQKLNDLRKANPKLKVDVVQTQANLLGSKVIQLTGSESGVKAGKKKILSWVDEELGPPKINASKGEILQEIDLGGAAGKVIGKNRVNLTALTNSAAASKVKIQIKRGTICYIYGKPEGVSKIYNQVKEIVLKHQDMVEKSEKEQEELMTADWVVDSSGSATPAPSQMAPESDWGGFKLAQAQQW